ncbi:thiosulfate transmembrane transporter [Aureococcus anophagefferens]|nr:thiosulfate transmembrane transporter [Aureococcus anophagefferens]
MAALAASSLPKSASHDDLAALSISKSASDGAMASPGLARAQSFASTPSLASLAAPPLELEERDAASGLKYVRCMLGAGGGARNRRSSSSRRGCAMNAGAWRGALAALHAALCDGGRRLEAVAVDLPGHGRSPAAPWRRRRRAPGPGGGGGGAWRGVARALLDVLGEVAGDRPVLGVGHSFGAVCLLAPSAPGRQRARALRAHRRRGGPRRRRRGGRRPVPAALARARHEAPRRRPPGSAAVDALRWLGPGDGARLPRPRRMVKLVALFSLVASSHSLLSAPPKPMVAARMPTGRRRGVAPAPVVFGAPVAPGGGRERDALSEPQVLGVVLGVVIATLGALRATRFGDPPPWMPLREVLAGGVAAATTEIALPAEVFKVRRQTGGAGKLPLLTTAGLAAGVLRGLCYHGLRLGLFPPVKNGWRRSLGPDRERRGLRRAGRRALQPLDLVKTRLQRDPERYPNSFAALVAAFKGGGVRRQPGDGARAAAGSAAQLATYDSVKGAALASELPAALAVPAMEALRAFLGAAAY